jgi:hypothetical protein
MNRVTIAAMSRDHSKMHENFAMCFDSVGMNGELESVIPIKFDDAYYQPEKNKANVEKFLKANINIGALLY